jgi:hypothetical protein
MGCFGVRQKVTGFVRIRASFLKETKGYGRETVERPLW